MQFALKNAAAKLANFNARSEINGDDRRPAADIKLETVITADDLAEFGPTLRGCWYDKENRLHNPKLVGPFGYEHEIVGATLVVHHGLGGKSDLVVPDCIVNRFALDPQDGGTVLLSLRIRCHPGEKEAGKLYAMVQSDIEVSLEPAQASLPLSR